MKNMAEKPINPNGMSKFGKSPYARPVLQVFGSVAKLTKGTGGTRIDGNQTATQNNPMGGSDRSIKQNVVCVGHHPLGIGLYLFDYKPAYRETWGHGRQFGVMADEVETVMPEAVSVHPDGYKQVNYVMLEISRNVH
jgi:hypothetical protein